MRRFNENEEFSSDTLRKVDKSQMASDNFPDPFEGTTSTSDDESHKSSLKDESDSTSKGSTSNESPPSLPVDDGADPSPALQIDESHSPPPLEEIYSRSSTPDYGAESDLEEVSESPKGPMKNAASSPIYTSTNEYTAHSRSKPVQHSSQPTSMVSSGTDPHCASTDTDELPGPTTKSPLPSNPSGKPARKESTNGEGMDDENDDQPLDQLETVQPPKILTPHGVQHIETQAVALEKPRDQISPKLRKSLGRIVASVDVCIPKPKNTESVIQKAQRQSPSGAIPITHVSMARAAIPSPPKSKPLTPSPTNISVSTKTLQNSSPSPQKRDLPSPVKSLPSPLKPATSPMKPQYQKSLPSSVKPLPTSPLYNSPPMAKSSSPPLRSVTSPKDVSPLKLPKGFKAINMLGRKVFSTCVVKNKMKLNKPGAPDRSPLPTAVVQAQEAVSSKAAPPSPSDNSAIPTVKAMTSLIRPAPVSVIHKNPTHQTSHPPSSGSAMRPVQKHPRKDVTFDRDSDRVSHPPRPVQNSHDEIPIHPTTTPQTVQQPKPVQQQHKTQNLSANGQPRSKVVHQKYPPPTPVEGLHGGQSKWPAIKTIKMANGETCGIKVQSPSVFTKVNIPNSKLREVKQQIAMQEAAKKKRSREYRVNKPTTYPTVSHATTSQASRNGKSSSITVPINTTSAETISFHDASTPPVHTTTVPSPVKTPTKPMSGFLARYSEKIIGTAKLKIRSPKTPAQSLPAKHDVQQEKPIVAEEPINDGESGIGGEVREQKQTVQSPLTSTELIQSPEPVSTTPSVQPAPSQPNPTPAQSLVLSAENQALVRKYLAQHPGEKMDFALSPVHPGTTINPAFPLVKVGDNDFQLIPKEVIMQKMQEEQKKLNTPRVLAPLRPKPSDGPDAQPAPVPTTTATVTTSRWRTNAIGEAELVDDRDSLDEDDGEPKKISLRTLSASSTGSPVKPVTAIIQPPRNEDHSDSDEEKVVEVSHVTAPPPPPANQAAVTVVSSPSTELAILPSTTATVTPGNIANQIHNRHKRQPIPRRKERPKKIKKISYIGKAKLAPLLPQPDKNGQVSDSKDSKSDGSESKSDGSPDTKPDTDDDIILEPIAIDSDKDRYDGDEEFDDGIEEETEHMLNELEEIGDDDYEYETANDYNLMGYKEPVKCASLEPVHYPDVIITDHNDHIIVSNPTQMETLEQIQARINHEIRSEHSRTSSAIVPPDGGDDEDGDLVIDEQKDEQVEENEPKSISSEFSAPKSPPRPKSSIPKSSTPKKSEDEFRYPSGPYIETDSDATPTKPKHVRMSTSSEDSVFLPVTAPKKIIVKKRKQSLTSLPTLDETDVLDTEPMSKKMTLKEDDESGEYDSEEEMDSDFDDMPDLEETPTDSFIDDLPVLEEIPRLPSKPRKRKSLPSQPPPAMSPVKRHRRGIRRTKSAVESRKWAGSSKKRDKAENGSTARTTANPVESTNKKNVKLSILIKKTRQILNEKRQRIEKTRAESDSASSSDDENLAELRTRMRERMKKSKKIKLDEVVKKLHQSHSENSQSSEVESIVEKPRIVANGEPATTFPKGSSGSSSEGVLGVDFSPNAIKRRKRILDRLADTPEYREARCSASGRSRRSNIARPSREAARSASESIQKNAKDENCRVRITAEPDKITPIKVKQQPDIKSEPKQVAITKPARSAKRKRPDKKTPTTPVSKKAREKLEKEHGWEAIGQSEKRSILKAGESTYVDRVCFNTIRDSRTGREIQRRDSVVIYAGEECQPYYAKIGDFYKDQYGSLMAWIYWYYRRDDVDAPNSNYNAGEDELISSRHHDSISVATILTTFSVLTFNQYCRYRARRCLELSSYFPTDGFKSKLEELRESSENDSPQVYFCRRFYDNSSRSICVMPSFLRSKEVQSTKTDTVIKLRPR